MKLMGNIPADTIFSGNFLAAVVRLPHIRMTGSDPPIPFDRFQFPIR